MDGSGKQRPYLPTGHSSTEARQIGERRSSGDWGSVGKGSSFVLSFSLLWFLVTSDAMHACSSSTLEHILCAWAFGMAPRRSGRRSGDGAAAGPRDGAICTASETSRRPTAAAAPLIFSRYRSVLSRSVMAESCARCSIRTGVRLLSSSNLSDESCISKPLQTRFSRWPHLLCRWRLRPPPPYARCA